MDTRESVNFRYGVAVAALIAAGIAFAFWQNSVYNAANRALAYSPSADQPSRVLLVVGLLAIAAAIGAVVYKWTRTLRSLDGAGEGGTTVKQTEDQSA